MPVALRFSQESHSNPRTIEAYGLTRIDSDWELRRKYYYGKALEEMAKKFIATLNDKEKVLPTRTGRVTVA